MSKFLRSHHINLSHLTTGQLEIALGASASLMLIIILIALALRKRRKGRTSHSQEVAKVPDFEEIFEVKETLLIRDPFDSSADSIIEESELQTIALTLIAGLKEHLTKMHENPSDQHKGILQIGIELENKGVTPIAYTQWSQSPTHGLAAKVILRGKVRTALLGPTLSLVRSTAPMRAEIMQIVESASAEGNNAYALAVDGLAYGVFVVSHRLQEIVD